MKIKYLILILSILLITTACTVNDITKNSKISRFKSDQDLINAFEEAKTQNRGVMAFEEATATGAQKDTSTTTTNLDYSETNIQVQGVDEADIIKTDGNYLYYISKEKLFILKAYPTDEAEILSEISFKDFYPTELFINEDRLLIFGNANYQTEEPQSSNGQAKIIAPEYYPYYQSFASARLYDISDKEEPELLKTVDLEGNYLTSRKIDEYVYFVVNTYPYFVEPMPLCSDLVPAYRESSNEEFAPVAKCTDIGYMEPVQATNFITIASISMETEDVEKEVIVGSGENVYASLDNLYIAQTNYPYYTLLGKPAEDFSEKTIVSKFNLDNGNINFENTGEVKGHILNQFSMDEYKDYFRIATTSGEIWNTNEPSKNNLYVLNEDLELVGSLEDLAPGEKIYSVRFMQERAYIVTFKKIDPLFVIDLSNPENPDVLGKLKIPGYSDYLHPYDATHLIGLGKDTEEAEESLKENRNLDFAWYQGIKIAIFDVTDVENPIELHKELIGDRGTDSPALYNHKAFLFDKERNLLVIPILLAERDEDKHYEEWEYGDYAFQGAYVYDLTLEEGFDLKGKITHYDNEDAFEKAGYYFYGTNSIERSLYIEDVLYTFSQNKIKLNDLDDLETLKEIRLYADSEDYPIEKLY